MRAFTENPIMTLMARQYAIQRKANQTIADTWTAFNPNGESESPANLGHYALVGNDWATFINGVFKNSGATVYFRAGYYNLGKSEFPGIALQGQDLYDGTSISKPDELYFFVQLTNGGTLMCSKVTKKGANYTLESIPFDNNVNDVLSALCAMKYVAEECEIPAGEIDVVFNADDDNKLVSIKVDNTTYVLPTGNVPESTGHAGKFLKAGSSGPVWAEPVTGTNDGTFWTELSVQTSTGLKTYKIARWSHFASFEFADVSVYYAMDDYCWSGFQTSTIQVATALGYTGSDFEEAVSYIQTAWGALTSEVKKFIAGKTDYGFLVSIKNGHCLATYESILSPVAVFQKGIDVGSATVTALLYGAYENNNFAVFDILDGVSTSSFLHLTVGNI